MLRGFCLFAIFCFCIFNHKLTSEIKIDYTNNSPDTLTFIWFHLWPNAYKNQNTALAKQFLEKRKTDFYFSTAEQRGYIDGLAFTINGKQTNYTYHPEYIDVARIDLPAPLYPGATCQIATPFKVKLPETFSRLGHIGQSYQITQWYPKPAVYDAKGWHPMPYLNQGEFYSEFGSFDVQISLPKNYVVGATGYLQNPEEKAWLNKRSAETEARTVFDKNDLDFPESDPEIKTLHYKANNIHDFAWFADKRFHVLQSSVVLPQTGRSVATWVMFTNLEGHLWKKNGILSVNKALLHYSSLVGDYPYDQCTAVESSLSAGAGMEYPMITVIGKSGATKSLENVIVHEVGHNWFYGILAPNERDHPWIDEGINSYYEERYMAEHYPEEDLVDGLPKALDYFMPPPGERDETYILYQVQQRQNLDQAITLHSNDYTNTNYGVIVYAKTAKAFNYLEKWLGTPNFDAIMQKFYQKYAFKHVYPEDLRRHFEAESGKWQEWFWDELLPTTKPIDYKITKVKLNTEKIGNTNYHKLTVTNKMGNTRGPYPIAAYKNDEIVHSVWYDGFGGEMEVLFPAGDYDYFRIDPARVVPEIDRTNNNYRLNGGNFLNKHMRPLKIKPLLSIETERYKPLYLTPIFAFNTVDKAMFGLALYNNFLPARKFTFNLLPMYALGHEREGGLKRDDKWVGTGNIDLNLTPKQGIFSRIQIGLSGKTFSHGYWKGKFDTIPNTFTYSEGFRFTKLAMAVNLRFRPKTLRSSIKTELTARFVAIDKAATPNFQIDQPDTTFYFTSPSAMVRDDYNVAILRFSVNNSRVINPVSLALQVEQGTRANQGSLFGKAFVEANYTLSTRRKNKGLHLRLYGGLMYNANLSLYDRSFRLNAFATDGPNDYLFDQAFIGRMENDNFWAAQIYNKSGGGLLLRNDAMAFSLGNTEKWMASLNTSYDLPIKLPLALYANAAYYPAPGYVGASSNLLFESGIAFKLIPGMAEVYFPVLLTGDLKTGVKTMNNPEKSKLNNYFRRVTFMINFNRLDLFKTLRDLNLNTMIG